MDSRTEAPVKTLQDLSYDVAFYALHVFTEHGDLRKFREYIEAKAAEWQAQRDAAELERLREALRSAKGRIDRLQADTGRFDLEVMTQIEQALSPLPA